MIAFGIKGGKEAGHAFINALKLTSLKKVKYIKKDEIGKGLPGMYMGINGDSSGVNKAVGRRVFAIKPFIRQRIASVNDQLAGKAEGEKIQGRRKLAWI